MFSKIIIEPKLVIEIEELHFKIGASFEENFNCTETALFHYEKAIAIKPDYAEAYFRIGKIMETKGDIKAASKKLDKAYFNCRKDCSETADNIRKYFIQFYEKRRKYLEDLVTKNEIKAEALVELASIVTNKFGNYKKGKKYLDVAVDLKNISSEIFVDAGLIAEENFDDNTVFKYALKGLVNFPQNCFLNWRVGDYYESIKKYDTAISYYKKAIETNEDAGLYLYVQIANIYQHKLKRQKEANKYFELGMEINSKYKY